MQQVAEDRLVHTHGLLLGAAGEARLEPDDAVAARDLGVDALELQVVGLVLAESVVGVDAADLAALSLCIEQDTHTFV